MIYFHNPHYSIFYGLNVFNALTGRFNHNKYWYIGRYLLKRHHKDVGILVNLDQNSFGMLFAYKIPFINRVVTLLELGAWLALNRVNPFRMCIRFSVGGLKCDDVVVVFAFDNMQRSVSLLENLAHSPCVKVIHLTHYMLDTGNIARHAEKMGVFRFAAESNLTKYPYFSKHFPYYKKDTYLLPFIPQTRFLRNVPFDGRDLKCVAMGTLTLLDRTPATSDLIDFFSTDCIHPMRKSIYDNRGKMQGLVDSYVDLVNSSVSVKDVHATRGTLLKVYSAIWNIFKAKQKSYFSVSSSDLFNRYAMFVIPEEINNLPGISWVEGMACGAAYIGLDDPMYRDLGLVPGKHYIAYDGTVEGLLAAVKDYQKNPAALREIAENGYRFVHDMLSGERAAAVFLSDLRRLSAQASRGVPPDSIEFHSSFTGGAK